MDHGDPGPKRGQLVAEQGQDPNREDFLYPQGCHRTCTMSEDGEKNPGRPAWSAGRDLRRHLDPDECRCGRSHRQGRRRCPPLCDTRRSFSVSVRCSYPSFQANTFTEEPSSNANAMNPITPRFWSPARPVIF